MGLVLKPVFRDLRDIQNLAVEEDAVVVGICSEKKIITAASESWGIDDGAYRPSFPIQDSKTDAPAWKTLAVGVCSVNRVQDKGKGGCVVLISDKFLLRDNVAVRKKALDHGNEAVCDGQVCLRKYGAVRLIGSVDLGLHHASILSAAFYLVRKHVQLSFHFLCHLTLPSIASRNFWSS